MLRSTPFSRPHAGRHAAATRRRARLRVGVMKPGSLQRYARRLRVFPPAAYGRYRERRASLPESTQRSDRRARAEATDRIGPTKPACARVSPRYLLRSARSGATPEAIGPRPERPAAAAEPRTR